MKSIVALFKLHGKIALVERRTRNIEYRIMIGSYFDGDLSFKYFTGLCFAESVQKLRTTLHHSWFGVRYSVFKLAVSMQLTVDGQYNN